MTNKALKEKELAIQEKAAEGTVARGKAAMKQADVAKDKATSEKWKNWSDVGSKAVNTVGSVIAALNDPRWYKKFPQDAQNVSRLPILLGPGFVKEAGHYFVYDNNDSSSLANVMRISWIPTIGSQVGTNASSYPINAAAQYLMSQQRKYNSRSGTEYDPGDEIQVLISIASIGSYLEKMKMALACLYAYDDNNPRLAEILYRAYGFTDYATVKDNKANLLDSLNQLIIRWNYLPLPRSLSFVDRWMWLHGIYADRNSAHAQLYVMDQSFFYVYDEANAKCTNLTGRNAVFSAAMANISNALDKFDNSSSITVMFSDIRAAFKLGQYYKISLLAQDPHINIACSDEVLSQIQNMTLPPCGPNGITGYPTGYADITQDSNGAIRQGVAAGSIGYGVSFNIGTPSTNKLFAPVTEKTDGTQALMFPTLNFYKDKVSEDDVLVASRFRAHYVVYEIANFSEQCTAYICGTELIEGISVVMRNKGNDGSIASNEYYQFLASDYDFLALGDLLTFDWCPRLYIAPVGSYTAYTTLFTRNVSSCNDFAQILEVGTEVMMDKLTLLNLHRACVMSEFTIDETTFVSKG